MLKIQSNEYKIDYIQIGLFNSIHVYECQELLAEQPSKYIQIKQIYYSKLNIDSTIQFNTICSIIYVIRLYSVSFLAIYC